MRTYPAIAVQRRDAQATPDDILLAELDGFSVSAAEEQPDGLRIFFVTGRDRDAALAALRAHGDLVLAPIEVSDEDWAARSQAALQPVTVGAITVAPPWTVTPDVRARAPHLVVIQPSMGFGTGHHASTRLCLDWLQRTPVSGGAMLDVGTGSGVLAIASVVLGASMVAGIDVDPDALTAARENAELNGCSGRIDWHEVDLASAGGVLGRSFNIICANLTGGLLFRDAATFGALAAPNGQLIVSGFQPPEAPHVIEAFKGAGWALDGHSEEDDWVGARLRRPSTPPATDR